MNIITWNCRGLLNPFFQSFVHSLKQIHSPTILIITETKVSGSRAKSITNRLQFNGAIHANNIGYTGGLWILWDLTQVEVTELICIEQEIDVMVKDLSTKISWLMTTVYASPRWAKRRLLWDNLMKVAELYALPWIITGDFNELLRAEDKFGGRPVNLSRAIQFQECLNFCGMIDLGFSSP
ncbi:uncharacterized protein LOC115966475 [Quercus lobata]|uniref:uncharacterized protein LOC115966475 n=1 Tax=Quercus lobata TaxID=97700 RepID=UPI001248624E|nr:uncharacterized protein LOC115966475 [Quercus lobata]